MNKEDSEDQDRRNSSKRRCRKILVRTLEKQDGVRFQGRKENGRGRGCKYVTYGSEWTPKMQNLKKKNANDVGLICALDDGPELSP